MRMRRAWVGSAAPSAVPKARPAVRRDRPAWMRPAATMPRSVGQPRSRSAAMPATCASVGRVVPRLLSAAVFAVITKVWSARVAAACQSRMCRLPVVRTVPGFARTGRVWPRRRWPNAAAAATFPRPPSTPSAMTPRFVRTAVMSVTAPASSVAGGKRTAATVQSEVGSTASAVTSALIAPSVPSAVVAMAGPVAGIAPVLARVGRSASSEDRSDGAVTAAAAWHPEDRARRGPSGTSALRGGVWKSSDADNGNVAPRRGKSRPHVVASPR